MPLDVCPGAQHIAARCQRCGRLSCACTSSLIETSESADPVSTDDVTPVTNPVGALGELDEGPYVCPGCHALGGERCARDCPDARMRLEDELNTRDWDEPEDETDD